MCAYIAMPIITPLHKLRFYKPNHIVWGWALSHPAVKIYIWICLTLLVQMLQGIALMSLAARLIVSALWIYPLRFYMLLRRTRWILFSVLLIYAYASPGVGVWLQLGAFSPVTEEVVAGLMQILRLLTVLAGVWL